MKDNDYEKARKSFIEYYNTCPLCKWPTTQCRSIEWNRECTACLNNKTGMWYSYTPKVPTRDSICSSSFYKTINNNK